MAYLKPMYLLVSALPGELIAGAFFDLPSKLSNIKQAPIVFCQSLA